MYISLLGEADQKSCVEAKVETAALHWISVEGKTEREMRVYIKHCASQSCLSFAEICTIIPVNLML